MKFIIILFFNFLLFNNLLSNEKISCRDLVDTPIKWSKCIKDKGIELGKKGVEIGKEGSKKLNTDSKLTDWLKSRKKN